jgi:hypothetical protein
MIPPERARPYPVLARRERSGVPNRVEWAIPARKGAIDVPGYSWAVRSPWFVMWILSGGCSREAEGDEHPCARDASPASIDEVIETIGTLPSPVTLDCFLISLERPLGLELTSNTFSAQPADGEASPRVFLVSDALTMSVVPSGVGRRLLEFGERTPADLSVKAELEFPITLPLDPALPFDRVATPDGPTLTGCGLCHSHETEVADGRFASTPLQPRSNTLVQIDTLLTEHELCDPDVEPERCGMLSALLDHGAVYHEPFPDEFDVLTPP